VPGERRPNWGPGGERLADHRNEMPEIEPPGKPAARDPLDPERARRLGEIPVREATRPERQAPPDRQAQPEQRTRPDEPQSPNRSR
jgi:hypothetical protein